MSVAGDDKAWQEFGELLRAEGDRFEAAMTKHRNEVAASLNANRVIKTGRYLRLMRGLEEVEEHLNAQLEPSEGRAI